MVRKNWCYPGLCGNCDAGYTGISYSFNLRCPGVGVSAGRRGSVCALRRIGFPSSSSSMRITLKPIKPFKQFKRKPLSRWRPMPGRITARMQRRITPGPAAGLRWWTVGGGRFGYGVCGCWVKLGPLSFSVYEWISHSWHFEAHVLNRRVVCLPELMSVPASSNPGCHAAPGTQI